MFGVWKGIAAQCVENDSGMLVVTYDDETVIPG
jgi:hypothetical protein